ncbi:MAG: hypothetical protein ABIP36_09170, partial [Acidimicrobiales bacterium]
GGQGSGHHARDREDLERQRHDHELDPVRTDGLRILREDALERQWLVAVLRPRRALKGRGVL